MSYLITSICALSPSYIWPTCLLFTNCCFVGASWRMSTTHAVGGPIYAVVWSHRHAISINIVGGLLSRHSARARHSHTRCQWQRSDFIVHDAIIDYLFRRPELRDLRQCRSVLVILAHRSRTSMPPMCANWISLTSPRPTSKPTPTTRPDLAGPHNKARIMHLCHENVARVFSQAGGRSGRRRGGQGRSEKSVHVIECSGVFNLGAVKVDTRRWGEFHAVVELRTPV